MDWGYAIAKGIIQGLAEFLPVSSTAHLLLFDALMAKFGFASAQGSPVVEEFFDIMLHIGTLAAVIFYFRQDWAVLWRIATGRGLPPNFSPPWDYPSLLKGLLISFITTAILVLATVKGSGLVFKALGWATPEVHDLSDYLKASLFVVIHLCVTGGLLWWAEGRIGKQRAFTRSLQVTPVQAFRVGIFQSIAAIFHGISRSGSTMTAGILNGWDRPTAARYSFMLSLPTFLAALVYELSKVIQHTQLSALPWPVMITATVISALVGYACVATFIPYLASHSLRGFSLYCWALAGVMAITFGVF
jgi:undecaprenyl-diphosphatase